MTRASVETDIEADQCSVAGCRNRWTCNWGHGLLCSMHDRARFEGQGQRPLPIPVPTHPAVQAFNERAERDEDEDYDPPLPF